MLGTGTLSATTIRSGSVGTGVATFTTTGLTVGSHTIKASYAGDASHESTTATVTQAILVDLSAGNALAC